MTSDKGLIKNLSQWSLYFCNVPIWSWIGMKKHTQPETGPIVWGWQTQLPESSYWAEEAFSMGKSQSSGLTFSLSFPKEISWFCAVWEFRQSSGPFSCLLSNSTWTLPVWDTCWWLHKHTHTVLHTCSFVSDSRKGIDMFLSLTLLQKSHNTENDGAIWEASISTPAHESGLMIHIQKTTNVLLGYLLC